MQLRYKRTSHTRIIRAYFAYSRMSICAYIRAYMCVYTCIYVSLLFIPTSFFVGQTEQASGFNSKFAYWENVNESSSFRSLCKFTDKLPFINTYLIYSEDICLQTLTSFSSRGSKSLVRFEPGKSFAHRRISNTIFGRCRYSNCLQTLTVKHFRNIITFFVVSEWNLAYKWSDSHLKYA